MVWKKKLPRGQRVLDGRSGVRVGGREYEKWFNPVPVKNGMR
jgi:hypothetical protein